MKKIIEFSKKQALQIKIMAALRKETEHSYIVNSVQEALDKEVDNVKLGDESLADV